MGPDIAIVVAGWAFALGLLIWSEHNWPALMRWLLRAAVFTGAVMVTLHGRYEITPVICVVLFAAGLLLAGVPIVHELIFHVRTRQ
jgi:hypothetical protein